MTLSPPSRNRLLLQHAILRLDALHNANKERMCKHIRIRHSTIQFAPDVLDDLEWVGNLSGPLLLNNNLLIRRDKSYVLSNGCMVAHKWMRYTVEPFDVPSRILLQLGLDIVVLPQNPLRQVTPHHFFAGYDPSGVPAYVLKRREVSPILV